ncbi:molybdenum ABC transporter ATP-binding protein [Kistimonas asteriae]|uniref:molybdenum ABC transporter ATP-binding protein n=1 Tax=Kistimonas asteriae TaxID=517724 RepID=UPI001BAB16FD|nr:molybdenum ABC transporter ATP-binding protein [Kistimonas asteriae]
MTLTLDIRLDRPGFQLHIAHTFPLNGITAIMGPSGCGKTTLLRTIAGLEMPDSGSIRMGDTAWLEDSKLRTAPQNRRLGYVFQETSLFPHLSVTANLDYARRRAHRKNDTINLDHVIDWCGIASLLTQKPDQLSGGQRQRVAIARAILSAPEVLLMDEPLASLDRSAKRELLPYIRTIHRHFSIPIIVVSHSQDEVARLADDTVLMDNGRIIASGQTTELFSRLDNALADEDALAVLETTVSGQETDYPATHLQADGQQITVSHLSAIQGATTRLLVPASEVSIMRESVADCSIQNRLLTRIDGIKLAGDSHVLLRLPLEHQALLALITRQSFDRMALKQGEAVYACFKAAGLQVLNP